MAFPIMELDYLNVKRTLRPPVPPKYRLGLIPAGHALRRSKHYLYPEGKAAATDLLAEWTNKTSFLEGKVYLDAHCSTVIVTGFFLEVLPPYASTWEGQTYTEVGAYPYLASPRDTLFSINLRNLDELLNAPKAPAWQETDVTTSLSELTLLVETADKEDFARTAEKTPPQGSTCEQHFTKKQLITLAQALYRVPYTIRRYTKRGAWDSVSWVYVLEPDAAHPKGKRFLLEAQSYRNPVVVGPCSFITASTSFRFAEPALHRAMTTLWNAAHTPTKRLPKLLQRGFGRRAQ